MVAEIAIKATVEVETIKVKATMVDTIKVKVSRDKTIRQTGTIAIAEVAEITLSVTGVVEEVVLQTTVGMIQEMLT